MERQWDGKTRGGRTGYAIFIRILKTFGLGPAYALLCLVVPYSVIAAPSQTLPGSVILLHDRLAGAPVLLSRLIPALRRSGLEL